MRSRVPVEVRVGDGGVCDGELVDCPTDGGGKGLGGVVEVEVGGGEGVKGRTSSCVGEEGRRDGIEEMGPCGGGNETNVRVGSHGADISERRC